MHPSSNMPQEVSLRGVLIHVHASRQPKFVGLSWLLLRSSPFLALLFSTVYIRLGMKIFFSGIVLSLFRSC